jgi:hypothetical protein
MLNGIHFWDDPKYFSILLFVCPCLIRVILLDSCTYQKTR